MAPDWWNRTKNAWNAFRQGVPEPGENDVSLLPKTYPKGRRPRFELLELYYKNTAYKDLFEVLPQLTRPGDFSKIEAMESPAVQAVDFHVMHLFPGDLDEALPIEVEGPKAEPVKEAAEQVLDWSNFELRKRDYSEWPALYGEVFLKAQASEDGTRSYLAVRRPEDVTEFSEDSRGNVNHARLDIDLGERKEGRRTVREWWTEVWSKEEDSYRQWVHEKGPDATLDDLGDPDDAAAITSFGYDFVPLVKGDFAGATGVFEKFLEAIDALNRQATKLRSRYYRFGEPDEIVERNEAGKGAVQTKTTESVDERPGPNKVPDNPYEVDTPTGRYIVMPGMATHKSAVPDIDYAAGLSQVEDTRQVIENNLAELRFFRGHDQGDPSAAALRQHIAPAVSRAKEARGNLENALVQGIQMCLTIGIVHGLFEEESIGTFEGGDFELSFSEREIVPETPAERSQRLTEQAQRFQIYQSLGMLQWALTQEGYSEEEAAEIVRQVEEAKAQAQQRAVEQAQATAAPQQNGNQNAGRTRLQDLLERRGGQQQ